MNHYTNTLLVRSTIDARYREAEMERLAAVGRASRPRMHRSILARLPGIVRFPHLRPRPARG
jgi:hypothetical protein